MRNSWRATLWGLVPTQGLLIKNTLQSKLQCIAVVKDLVAEHISGLFHAQHEISKATSALLPFRVHVLR